MNLSTQNRRWLAGIFYRCIINRILAFIHIIDDEKMFMIAEPSEESKPVDDPEETEESIDDIIEQGQTGLDDVLEGDEWPCWSSH